MAYKCRGEIEAAPSFAPQPKYAPPAVKAGAPLDGLGMASWSLSLFLLLLLVCAGVFLSVAHYARKQVVTGVLSPVGGLVKVGPTRPGVVAAVAVKQGQVVAAGDTLFTLSVDSGLAGGQAVGALALAANQDQDRFAGDQLAASGQTVEAKRADIAVRRSSYTDQLAKLDEQVDALTRQSGVMHQVVQSYTILSQQGFASPVQLAQYQNTSLAIDANKASVERQRLDMRRALAQLDNEENQIAAEQATALAQISGQRAQLLERRASSLGGTEIVIRAEQAGRVATVQTEVGRVVAPGAVMATLLPVDGGLEAKLYVPSRAIGFVRPGDKVRLMYDAFAYQQFGAAFGKVAKVADAPIDAPDLPTSMAGAKEALYPVEVALDDQIIRAYGRDWPLAAGMKVNADILLEQRSFIAWLFDPVIAARERARESRRTP